MTDKQISEVVSAKIKEALFKPYKIYEAWFEQRLPIKLWKFDPKSKTGENFRNEKVYLGNFIYVKEIEVNSLQEYEGFQTEKNFRYEIDAETTVELFIPELQEKPALLGEFVKRAEQIKRKLASNDQIS